MSAAYILCEFYGPKPRGEDMHLRELQPYIKRFAPEWRDGEQRTRAPYEEFEMHLGGRHGTALCKFTGKLYDHPTPAFEKRDISGICPKCLSTYKREMKKNAK